MKIAFYIEDGLQQIVLTPETEYEKKMLQVIDDPKYTLEIKHGSFYDCNGGWVRQTQTYETPFLYGGRDRKEDDSTILVMREAKT